jgi:hypothetical protein
MTREEEMVQFRQAVGRLQCRAAESQNAASRYGRREISADIFRDAVARESAACDEVVELFRQALNGCD